MKKSELRQIIREEIDVVLKQLKEQDHKLYAKQQFEAELVEGKVGILYHSTNGKAALEIIKQNTINPANITLKPFIGTDNPPWWFSDEFGEPQPLYGDFVYTATKKGENYYGVSNPEVTFTIDGDALKNNGVNIFKAPETVEEGVCLVQGPISMKFVKQVEINKDLISKEDLSNISSLLNANNRAIKDKITILPNN